MTEIGKDYHLQFLQATAQKVAKSTHDSVQKLPQQRKEWTSDKDDKNADNLKKPESYGQDAEQPQVSTRHDTSDSSTHSIVDQDVSPLKTAQKIAAKVAQSTGVAVPVDTLTKRKDQLGSLKQLQLTAQHITKSSGDTAQKAKVGNNHKDLESHHHGDTIASITFLCLSCSTHAPVLAPQCYSIQASMNVYT